MKASDVRRSFLDFFKGKEHEVCASAPLVPQNDPTLMFANAGMVPFKDVFTGKDKRAFTRATSSQKCIRISGKHNDLENVGVTARHHTFFEMLGNFSFGDYFKEGAITYAWELLTKVWQLPQDRMVITVFGGAGDIAADDEARALWKSITGFPDEKIIGLGLKDNFWQMGDTGPCGPCTEIHFWNGEGAADLSKFLDEPPPDGKGWMEIWNLVFMQYERYADEGGVKQRDLPKPCVDTGAGLERVASVLQGKTSNYDTDLLRALVDKASEISGKPYRGSQADDDVSMRVIADHARLTAFLIAEGIFPDKNGREYVLRRVMRRAIRHGHRLGISKPFLHEVALEVVKEMGDQYPELVSRKDIIASVAEQEEVRFRATIDRGLKILDEEIATLRGAGGATLAGNVVFELEATHGFPNDLTAVIAQERDVQIDVAGYEAAKEKHKEVSGGADVGDAAVDEVYRNAKKAAEQPIKFTGYEREEGEGKVLFVADGVVVTDVTPFYGESGGQVGDKGRIVAPNGVMQVEDTQKPLDGLVVHLGKVEGAIAVGDKVKLEVDHALRTATRRNHSATHLLHWALRTVIGETATQKGSLVSPDRLRFDYSGGRALTTEEIERIEDLVNGKILLDAPVQTEVLPIDDAKKRGAMMIFGDKYGDTVRVLTMTKDSIELCGGTHARALGEIGLFKITSEGGIAAGVRRIEAATGMNALAYVRQLEGTVKAAARLVKGAPNELPEKIEKLLEDGKKLDKELTDTKRKLAMGGGGSGGGGIDDLAAKARTLAFGKVLAVKVDVGDGGMLREVAEKLRDKLGDAVVLVGSVVGPKAMLVCTVSKSLTERFKAGDLIRPIAATLGGSGGGRPDMAQAGGTEIAKLDEALEQLYSLVT